MPELTKELKDEITKVAIKRIEACIKFRQDRLDEVQKNEDLYFNKVIRRLNGRFNIPLPVMSGFIDTLVAKIDDPPQVNFDPTEEADKIRAKRVTAAWEIDSGPTRGMWDIKDILGKKLGAFSGRVIYKLFAESDPEYKSHFENVDIFDHLFEAGGGWHLETHNLAGQENVFKTRSQLKAGVESGLYDKEQVELVFNRTEQKEFVHNEGIYKNRAKRFSAVGLDSETNNFIGEDMYALAEIGIEYKGTRYYQLLCPRTGTWIRTVLNKEISALDKWIWVSWATHYDAWNYLSKSAADDIRPIAEAMKVTINGALDNLIKRTFQARAYNSKVFTDPSQLEIDRPDKLIAATPQGGKSIAEGIYQFETPDNTRIVLNLNEYFNNFLGQKTGITSETQGASDEKRVGIAVLNQQQTADRFGLTNKFYRQAHAELGERYYHGLKEHAPSEMLVRMIGERGAEWQTMTKDDLKPIKDFDIRITGGNAEAQASALKKQEKEAALVSSVEKFPDLFNPKKTVQVLLDNGGWEIEEVRALLDKEADGDEEQGVRASQAIQEIIHKPEEMPDLFDGATTAFLNKLLAYTKRNELKVEVEGAILDYMEAHAQIVARNMNRLATEKVQDEKVAQEQPIGGVLQGGGQGVPSSQPAPNLPIPEGVV